ncbi:MAG: TonB-dependent receptor plug domain-containing protein [Gemmatimonadota bacterium]|nr:TonB-dependent receptor plug domain-containing protein [Gemmatimonadota bacterium]
MKLSRDDLAPVMGIAFGALVGAAALGVMGFDSFVTVTYEGVDHVRHVDRNEWIARVGPEHMERIEAPRAGITIIASPVGEAPVVGERIDIVESGEPSTIRLRSVSTEPLVYVDGVRVEGGIPNLPSDAIDRVEILKGEAAVKLFGGEAENGVVQIFTKAGAALAKTGPGR